MAALALAHLCSQGTTHYVIYHNLFVDNRVTNYHGKLM
jgi:hypothetical protein